MSGNHGGDDLAAGFTLRALERAVGPKQMKGRNRQREKHNARRELPKTSDESLHHFSFP